jgi:hypothetical protein
LDRDRDELVVRRDAMRARSLGRLLILILAVWMSLGDSALSETPQRDVAQYAATYGVTVGQALRRLQLQSAVAKLEALLQAAEPTTFAGIWIEHSPYRVVARFTRGGSSTLGRYVRGGALEAISAALSAQYTLSDLRTDLSHLAVAGDRPFDAGINVLQNTIDVETTSQQALSTWMAAHNVAMPSSARVRLVAALPRPLTNIYGGLSLAGGGGFCTSGFGVVDAGGTRGITTAGHCSSVENYQGVDLPFISGNYGGSYDVQWHTAPGFTVVNSVADDTGFRSITSKTYWSSQSVGAFVCKYGIVTGYGCGTIARKDDIPSCIPGARPVWVRVSVGGANGDSGGPVYLQNSAYGTISCGDASVIIYDAVDFVEGGVGVTVLTN